MQEKGGKEGKQWQEQSRVNQLWPLRTAFVETSRLLNKTFQASSLYTGVKREKLSNTTILQRSAIIWNILMAGPHRHTGSLRTSLHQERLPDTRDISRKLTTGSIFASLVRQCWDCTRASREDHRCYAIGKWPRRFENVAQLSWQHFNRFHSLCQQPKRGTCSVAQMGIRCHVASSCPPLVRWSLSSGFVHRFCFPGAA